MIGAVLDALSSIHSRSPEGRVDDLGEAEFSGRASERTSGGVSGLCPK